MEIYHRSKELYEHAFVQRAIVIGFGLKLYPEHLGGDNILVIVAM